MGTLFIAQYQGKQFYKSPVLNQQQGENTMKTGEIRNQGQSKTKQGNIRSRGRYAGAATIAKHDDGKQCE